MSARSIAAVLLAGLAACSQGPDPEALERQYEIMQRNNSSSAELCAKAREVADAWLAREDEDQYQLWDITSSLQCNRAAIGN